MNIPITMDNILVFFGVIMAVEGVLKAIEWGIGKINSAHDKNQKIDENSESLEEYKKRTDARLTEVEKKVDAGHKKAFESLGEMKTVINQAVSESSKETLTLLNQHKKEYMDQIESVKEDITELKAEYQSKAAVIEIQISNLEKAQNKHNNLVERMYAVEKKTEVHDEKIKVSNHRLDDIEQEIRIGH